MLNTLQFRHVLWRFAPSTFPLRQCETIFTIAFIPFSLVMNYYRFIYSYSQTPTNVPFETTTAISTYRCVPYQCDYNHRSSLWLLISHYWLAIIRIHASHSDYRVRSHLSQPQPNIYLHWKIISNPINFRLGLYSLITRVSYQNILRYFHLMETYVAWMIDYKTTNQKGTPDGLKHWAGWKIHK